VQAFADTDALRCAYSGVADLIMFYTPLYRDMCPTPDACVGALGYKVITATNPTLMDAAVTLPAPGNNSTVMVQLHGGSTSCPPNCPGAERRRVLALHLPELSITHTLAALAVTLAHS
jgi:hypothetical protein